MALFIGQDQTLPPIVWGKEVEGFQLSVVGVRDTFRLGEPIRVVTYIRNNGDATELFINKTRRLTARRLIHTQKNARIRKAHSAETVQVLRRRDGRPLLTPDGKEMKMEQSLGVASSPMPTGRVKRLETVDVSEDFKLTEPGEYILQTTWEVPLRGNPEKRVPIVANEIFIRIVRL